MQTVLASTYTREGNRFYVGGKLAGWLIQDRQGNQLFISVRKRAQHHFRIYHGWGISEDLLRHLKALGVAFIVLEVDDCETLKASPNTWLQFGVPYQRAPFEPQLILPEQFMKKTQRR